ncbi:hypothetical protein AB6H46_22645 [Vibrio alginolyticus]|uniref:hypothetical protein n=1 Tax=Vibrio alginolyticus TaxID=663 RepID=UPI00354D7E39|nr:hypothetical protein [Vibrio alginolyticus]
MTLSIKSLACLLTLAVILTLLIFTVLEARKEPSSIFLLSIATACINVLPKVLTQLTP